MRWLTNFYDFSFKWTATEAIGIHTTKAWLSQLVNFKNAIWTLEERYAIKFCSKLGKNATETYGMIQTGFGASCMNRASVFECIRDSRKAGNLWGMISVRGVRKSIHQSWLAKGLGLGYYVEVLREFRKSFLGKMSALFKLDLWHFQPGNTPVHNYILVTDYLTKMGIKTVPQPPYSPDVAPCDFWLFPKLRGCRRYETIEEMKEAIDEGHWHAHTRGLPRGLPEVVVTVQQVHCSRRRLLRRRFEFHVCTINKSAHTKKVWKLIVCSPYF